MMPVAFFSVYHGSVQWNVILYPNDIWYTTFISHLLALLLFIIYFF